LPPIGQHAVFTGDQPTLDDGAASVDHIPPGETRDYSAVRKYQIDLTTFTATEIYTYNHDPAIYSPFCSSVYEDAPSNYVIDYTVAGPISIPALSG
jgi:hypothetical protein